MRAGIGAALVFLGVLAACSPEVPQKVAAACGLDEGARGSFVAVPSGSFVMGADPQYPEEGPPTRVHVDGFELAVHEVTNAEFSAFVAATGYVTEAEQSGAGGSARGSGLFAGGAPGQVLPWRLDTAANWRAPDGPGSSLEGRAGEPVVHVSLRDARAYAAWAGARLPSEVEWEYAAALGRAAPAPGSAQPKNANTWQGLFPFKDAGTDGFAGRAPAGCFGADALGLHDMLGNVWEWTETPYAPGQHTIKGGSYLCAENFCRRYRIAARQGQDVDFSMSHIGFRVVRDVTGAEGSAAPLE